MSRIRTATLPSRALPDAAALNRALKDERLPLSVDPAWGVAMEPGYMPCTLAGEDAGFQLQRAEASGQLVLTVRWGGDPRERVAALAVLTALAGRFEATVDDSAGTTHDAAALAKATRAALAELELG
jgi:hypothetical protein